MADTFLQSQAAANNNLNQAERQLATAQRLTVDFGSAVADRNVARSETLYGQVNTYLGLARTSNSRALEDIQNMARTSTGEAEKQSTVIASERYQAIQNGIDVTQDGVDQLLQDLQKVRYDLANNVPNPPANSSGDQVITARQGNQNGALVSAPPTPLQTFDDDGNLVDVNPGYSEETNADQPQLLSNEDIGLQDGTSTVGGDRAVVRATQTQPGPVGPSDDTADIGQTSAGSGGGGADGRPVIASEFLSPIQARPNALAKLASMTYTISIYLMTNTEYRTMLNSRQKSITSQSLIIQSGGIDKTPIAGVGQRNPFFKYDYYIDDVQITNLVGTQSGNRAHNSAELTFNIQEPNGITLLPTLREAVTAHNRINDPTVSPINTYYLMVIRFYGYDANGQLINGSQLGQREPGSDRNAILEKWIPFTIANITYRIGTKNVEYRVQAVVPQTSIAYGQIYATIPFDFELKAPDIATLLNGRAVLGYAANAATGVDALGNNVGIQVRAEDGTVSNLRRNPETGDLYDPGTTSAAPAKASALTAAKKYTQGLCEALNEHQQELVKNGQQSRPDVYEIVLENVQGLKDAKIAKPPPQQDKSRTAFTPGQNAQDDLLMRKTSYDKESKNFSVTRGTQIVQLIDLIIRNSTYITSQQNLVQDPKTLRWKVQTPVKVLQWYKIRSQVIPLEYDQKRRQFSHKIRYLVSRYQINDPRIPEFPNTGYRGAHKIYNYWFTGQNTEVLDLEVQVNANYVVTFGNNQNKLPQPEVGASGRLWEKRAFANKPNMEGTGGPGDTNSIAATLAERLYQDVDIQTANLTIIGDPDWLIQTDVFYTGLVDTTPSSFYLAPNMPDGSVNTDAQEVLYEIRFNPAADYNISTGQAEVNANNTAYSQATGERNLASQSSVFATQLVYSNFKQGKFTQRLVGTIRNFDSALNTNVSNQAAAVVGNRYGSADVSPVTNSADGRRDDRAPLSSAARASQSTDTRPVTPSLLELEFGAASNPDAVGQAVGAGTASQVAPKAGSNTVSDDAPQISDIIAP